jgi:hypothetical protein
MKYLTAIISIALTSALLLTELFSYSANHMVEHAILGSIISALFLLFCNYGLEMINWVVLACLPVMIFIGWMLTPSEQKEPDNEYDTCDKPDNSCDCPKQARSECQKEKRKKSMNIYDTTILGDCPAKPIDIRTQCGITRYS